MARMHKDFPLVFHDPDYAGLIDPDALRLAYAFGSAGKQRRLQGRLVAEPRIDLEDYQFRAVFDWIEIGMGTGKELAAVNFQRSLMARNKIHKGFRSCYVWGPHGETSYRGQYFRVRMQEPQPEGLVALLRAFLKELGRRGEDLRDMPLVGLEMSVDAYPVARSGMTDGDLALARMRMTELMRKHLQFHALFRDGRRQPRFKFERKSLTENVFRPEWAWMTSRRDLRASGLSKEDFAASFARFYQQPFIDSTFYYGDRKEQLHFRSMDKITDRRKGMVAEDLDVKDRRSRLEFTVMDKVAGDGTGPEAIGFGTMEDLLMRGLAGTGRLLSFALPTFSEAAKGEPDAEEWAVFCKSGVAGLAHKLDVEDRLKADPDVRHAMARRVMDTSGKCLKYSRLNRRVGRAIERLEKRWQAAL